MSVQSNNTDQKHVAFNTAANLYVPNSGTSSSSTEEMNTKTLANSVGTTTLSAATSDSAGTSTIVFPQRIRIKDPSVSQMVRFTSEIGTQLMIKDGPKKSSLNCPLGVVQILVMLLCGMDNKEDQLKMFKKLGLLETESESKAKGDDAVPLSSYTPYDYDEAAKLVAQKQNRLLKSLVTVGSPEDPTMPTVSSGTAMGYKNDTTTRANESAAPMPTNFASYRNDIIRGLLNGEVFKTEDIAPLKKWVLDQIPDAELKENMSKMIDESLAEDWKTASAALLHVFYFKASWENEFDEKVTGAMDVLGADGTWYNRAVMEKTFDNMNVYVGKDYTLFEIPYKSDKGGESPALSYVGVIPHDQSKIDELVPRIPDILQNDYPKTEPRKVLLQLPKQKLDRQVSLLESLQSLDFPVTAILGKIGPMKKVNTIKQQITGKLDEKGTKVAVLTYASMATAAFIMPKPTVVPILIDARRPFIGCVIGNMNDQQVPLIMSKVADGEFLVRHPNTNDRRPKINHTVTDVPFESIQKRMDGEWKKAVSDPDFKQFELDKMLAEKPRSCKVYTAEGGAEFTVLNYSKKDISIAMRREVLMDGGFATSLTNLSNGGRVVAPYRLDAHKSVCVVYDTDGGQTKMVEQEVELAQGQTELRTYGIHLDQGGASAVKDYKADKVKPAAASASANLNNGQAFVKPFTNFVTRPSPFSENISKIKLLLQARFRYDMILKLNDTSSNIYMRAEECLKKGEDPGTVAQKLLTEFWSSVK